jgi:hypothetical protein
MRPRMLRKNYGKFEVATAANETEFKVLRTLRGNRERLFSCGRGCHFNHIRSPGVTLVGLAGVKCFDCLCRSGKMVPCRLRQDFPGYARPVNFLLTAVGLISLKLT